MQADLRRVVNERDGALQAFARIKRNFALFRLQRFAHDRATWGIHVTIRFADYNDYPLVEQIKALIHEHLRWPIEEDASNKPVIPAQAWDVKVVIRSNAYEKMAGLAVIIEEGELLPCGITLTGAMDAPDRYHLVFEVMPTISKR